MTGSDEKLVLTQGELAHLGEGHVAYLRKMNSDDLAGRFPNLPAMAPGLELWALFSADGQPIMLADHRDGALAGALENDLTTVSIH